MTLTGSPMMRGVYRLIGDQSLRVGVVIMGSESVSDQYLCNVEQYARIMRQDDQPTCPRVFKALTRFLRSPLFDEYIPRSAFDLSSSEFEFCISEFQSHFVDHIAPILTGSARYYLLNRRPTNFMALKVVIRAIHLHALSLCWKATQTSPRT